VRYYPPSGDLFFDVMTRLGDAASFETVDAEIKQVDGIRVPVATRATGRWRHVRTPGAWSNSGRSRKRRLRARAFRPQAVTLVRLRIPGSQVSRAELTAIAIQIVLAVIAFR